MGDMSVFNISGLDDICIHLRASDPTLESIWVVSESVLAPEPEPELSPSIETRMRLSYHVCVDVAFPLPLSSSRKSLFPGPIIKA
jgi:hypothetical protein